MNANLTDYFIVKVNNGIIVRRLLTVDDFPNHVLLHSCPCVLRKLGVIGFGSAEGPIESAWQELEKKLWDEVHIWPQSLLTVRREMKTPGSFRFELVGISKEEHTLSDLA